MSIKSVIINEDVYFICLTHALTTEKEEIMGLLLGDIHVILIYIYIFIIFSILI